MVHLEWLQTHFGIFNTKRKSSLSNFIIEVDEENVFVNSERNFKVKGYDKYYNPIEVDLDEIKWTTTGVDGKIEDGKLIAGNDAGTIHKSCSGVYTIAISLPCRYIHSGTSVADTDDMTACYELAVALCEEYANA